MKFPPNPKRVIAIIEKSTVIDDEKVGDMWLETQSFDRNATIHEIVSWAHHCKCTGRLIITVDESQDDVKPVEFVSKQDIAPETPVVPNQLNQQIPPTPQSEQYKEDVVYIPSIEEVMKMTKNQRPL